MKSKVLKMSVFLSIFLFISAISAQPNGNRKGGCMGGCMGSGNEPGFQNGPGMMLEKLDLTKDQQEKVDKLKGNHQKEAGTLRDDLAKLRIDKKAMLREDNVKKDALLDVEKKMNDIQGKLAILNTNFMLDIRDVLSPEQRSKLKDMNMKGGMRHQRGGHERGSEDSPKN